MKISANNRYQQREKADGFRAFEFMTEQEFRDIVLVSDHTPGVFSDGRRSIESWVSSDFLYMDIDSGLTIAEFQQHRDFIDRFYILVTSKSHQKPKDDQPACDRFHVFFPVVTITDRDEMDAKIKRLISTYPFADKAAGGVARFFFASKDSTVIWHDGTEYQFPVHDKPFDDDDFEPPKKPAKRFDTSQVKKYPTDRKELILDGLKAAIDKGFIGSYQEYIDLGMGLMADGYSFQDWQDLLRHGKPSDSMTLAHCQEKWDGFNPSRITGGKLMYFCRLVDPGFMVSKYNQQKAAVRIAPNVDKPVAMETDFKKSLPMESWFQDHCIYEYEKDENGDNTAVIKKFKVKPTIEQFRVMLSWYGIFIRENLMTHKVECQIPGNSKEGKQENAAVGIIKNLCVVNNLPVANANFDSYITTLAHNDKYHPVQEWMDRLEWDGVSRIAILAATIKHDSEFSETFKCILLRKWLISCVAAIYEDNYRGRGTLTLQGAQHKGKTAWFRSLFPNVEWFKDGLTLDPRSKDSISIAISNWVCELGELEGTFKRADISALKAFLTNSSDTIRLPFERREETYKRRTIFCATVNDSKFLADQTGSSRFWVIPITDVDYNHKIDLGQLWAEVKDLYMSGTADGAPDALWWLSEGEELQLGESNTVHTEIGEFDELVKNYFLDYERDRIHHWNATEVLRQIGYDKPTKWQINNIHAVLLKLGFKNTKVRGIRGFYMPDPSKATNY